MKSTRGNSLRDEVWSMESEKPGFEVVGYKVSNPNPNPSPNRGNVSLNFMKTISSCPEIFFCLDQALL